MSMSNLLTQIHRPVRGTDLPRNDAETKRQAYLYVTLPK